jgi:hypothetical protein
MQYRNPVGGGPSSKTWPRWLSACLLRTSVRTEKNRVRSSLLTIFSGTRGLLKLGQPVPESNNTVSTRSADVGKSSLTSSNDLESDR